MNKVDYSTLSYDDILNLETVRENRRRERFNLPAVSKPKSLVVYCSYIALFRNGEIDNEVNDIPKPFITPYFLPFFKKYFPELNISAGDLLPKEIMRHDVRLVRAVLESIQEYEFKWEQASLEERRFLNKDDPGTTFSIWFIGGYNYVINYAFDDTYNSGMETVADNIFQIDPAMLK